jgi:hypothetical protein
LRNAADEDDDDSDDEAAIARMKAQSAARAAAAAAAEEDDFEVAEGGGEDDEEDEDIALATPAAKELPLVKVVGDASADDEADVDGPAGFRPGVVERPTEASHFSIDWFEERKTRNAFRSFQYGRPEKDADIIPLWMILRSAQDTQAGRNHITLGKGSDELLSVSPPPSPDDADAPRGFTLPGPLGLVFVCGDHNAITGYDAIGVHVDTACMEHFFFKELKCSPLPPFSNPLPGDRRHLQLPFYAATRQWRGPEDATQTNLVFFGLHGLNPRLAEQLSAATTQAERVDVYLRWQLEVDDGLVAAMQRSVPTGALYVPERGFYDVVEKLLRPWVDASCRIVEACTTSISSSSQTSATLSGLR